MNKHIYTFTSGLHAVTVTRREVDGGCGFALTLSALDRTATIERPLLSCDPEQGHALWELFDAATDLVSWLRAGETLESWCGQLGLDPGGPRVCAPGFGEGNEGNWLAIRARSRRLTAIEASHPDEG